MTFIARPNSQANPVAVLSLLEESEMPLLYPDDGNSEFIGRP